MTHCATVNDAEIGIVILMFVIYNYFLSNKIDILTWHFAFSFLKESNGYYESLLFQISDF